MRQLYPTTHVLVLFQTADAMMEALALAAALGASEARAKIRLRRLRPSTLSSEILSDYGNLLMDDFAWADGVIVGIQDRTSLRRFQGPDSVARISLLGQRRQMGLYIQ